MGARGPQTPEARAKVRERMRELWAGPWGDRQRGVPHKRRPPAGTQERRMFEKIATRCKLGAAAAHAELGRGKDGTASTSR